MIEEHNTIYATATLNWIAIVRRSRANKPTLDDRYMEQNTAPV